MNSVQRHLTRFPKARRETIEFLNKRDQTLQQLKAEISATRRRKFFERLLYWMWRR